MAMGWAGYRRIELRKGCIVQKRTASRIWSSLFLPILALAICLSGILSPVLPASASEKYAAIVVDLNSGRTLFARNADSRRYPASLTKMMTLYVLFEELEAGNLSLNTKLTVSANAARQAPSKLGLKAGRTIKVEDALLALVTKSANDMAVVIAEKIGGSVSGFATRMNRAARTLGMKGTTFRNPHGLPNSEQVTTARDMVRLAQALQNDFPSYYKYFSTRTFTYRGARYRNHNNLLGRVEGVDGIKTGYTRASGFNLVTNVERGGRHIVAVVMGGKTSRSRDAHMRELIAEYLPKAKRGASGDAVVIADRGGEEEIDAAPAIAQVALPRARPVEEVEEEPAEVLAYAPAARPRDVVAAAMAEVATPQGDINEVAEQEIDPIAVRIATATEVAEFADAEATSGSDPIARLTRIARIRAGEEDIIASGSSDATRAASEAGWHIQIGAVPTEDGAQALIERAQASLGQVLASLSPLTQEVERDGTTLYRARFAGFSDKEEARETCAKLKSKSFACLAVPN
jgi:D-alanyl-D-alanine carboxypeptidase